MSSVPNAEGNSGVPELRLQSWHCRPGQPHLAENSVLSHNLTERSIGSSGMQARHCPGQSRRPDYSTIQFRVS